MMDGYFLPLIRFKHGGKLIEINSHSLFSKYYSESGKMVQSLFGQINHIADNQDCFIVLLMGNEGLL